MTQHYGVECWLDGKRLFMLRLDSVDPDQAREIALEVLRLQRGGDFDASEEVTLIVRPNSIKGVSPYFPWR